MNYTALYEISPYDRCTTNAYRATATGNGMRCVASVGCEEFVYSAGRVAQPASMYVPMCMMHPSTWKSLAEATHAHLFKVVVAAVRNVIRARYNAWADLGQQWRIQKYGQQKRLISRVVKLRIFFRLSLAGSRIHKREYYSSVIIAISQDC